MLEEMLLKASLSALDARTTLIDIHVHPDESGTVRVTEVVVVMIIGAGTEPCVPSLTNASVSGQSYSTLPSQNLKVTVSPGALA